jgi:hypothetical protein
MSTRARAGERIWRGRALRQSFCLATVTVALVAPPTGAHAETAITAQAVADDGAFLPYAPPPAQLGGLCLVDTGVNVNPDTEGVVVDRTAIDGGLGEDVSPTLHGTVMAMMAGAPGQSRFSRSESSRLARRRFRLPTTQMGLQSVCKISSGMTLR